MTVEVSLILTGVSVVAAIYFAIRSKERADTTDIEAKAKESAILNTKLDTIGGDVRDIKYDVTGVKKDVQRLSEEYIKLDQSLKSEHSRIDSIERRIDGEKTHDENKNGGVKL